MFFVAIQKQNKECFKVVKNYSKELGFFYINPCRLYSSCEIEEEAPGQPAQINSRKKLSIVLKYQIKHM